MDNTELNLRFRKDSTDSTRKSGQAINTGNKNILDASILKLSQYRKPKPFGSAQPEAGHWPIFQQCVPEPLLMTT